jgi:hypothetical protein
MVPLFRPLSYLYRLQNNSLLTSHCFASLIVDLFQEEIESWLNPGLLKIIHFRMFCAPICYLKSANIIICKYMYCYSPKGKEIVLECLRALCWGGCLELAVRGQMEYNNEKIHSFCSSLRSYYQGGKIHYSEMNWECSTRGSDETCIKYSIR